MVRVQFQEVEPEKSSFGVQEDVPAAENWLHKLGNVRFITVFEGFLKQNF